MWKGKKIGETGGKGKRRIKELNAKYSEEKGGNLVIEEFKPRLIAKKTKIQ